jgi:hypothetical protein
MEADAFNERLRSQGTPLVLLLFQSQAFARRPYSIH